MTTELVTVDGLSDVLKAFDEFPDRLMPAVREGLTFACEALAARARELVPLAPPTRINELRYGAVMGSLRASIRVLPTTINGSWVNCQVGAGNKTAYYARWVEFGTQPHFINRGSNVERPRPSIDHKMHPGSRPVPFMRTAVDSGGDLAIARFAEFVKRRVEVEGLK